MYSVVLMAALATGTTAPDCHPHSYGCCGGYYSYGCCGGYSGCCGGYGYSYGCCGGYGCYGSYSYGACYGCCGGSPYSMMPYPYATPATPAPSEKLPPPKDDPKKPEEPKKEGALAPNVGRMVVEVPVDAKLFIDGQLMKTTNEKRSFRTPELVPGQQYFYDVRAEITIDGKTEVENVRVVVQGGKTAQAAFPKLVAAVQASKALAASR